jgi:hypothetical protein
VGAYDAAAGAAASAADTIKHTAAQVTGHTDSSSSAGQSSGSDSTGDGFGHGSGSSSSPSGGGYAGGERSSLGQAWEDLKHGGAKAPWAVSSAVSGIDCIVWHWAGSCAYSLCNAVSSAVSPNAGFGVLDGG